MASCITSEWKNTAPQARLDVTLNTSSSDGDTAVLDWVLYYVAHGYAANTSGKARNYTVTIGGTTITGSYNIDGVKSTTEIKRGTVNITKTTSAQNITFSVSFAFDITWSGTYGGTKSASGSISVPALTTYTVSYNANGGSGEPASQIKYHGKDLTISGAIPYRTGYTFNNWALSKAEADNNRWYYTPGSSCGRNENLTLYAVWDVNKYPVNYDANGGTGVPASQEKEYGKTLTLSDIAPTRENYTFKGWATAASATTEEYAKGASYTANSAVTLYAIWELAYTKPRIKNFSVYRCSEDDDSIDDNGTALGISFEWATDRYIQSAVLSWTPANDEYSSDTLDFSEEDVSKKSGTYVNQGIRAGFSLETTYQITLTIRDGDGDCYNVAFATLPGASFAIDFKAGGNGAAFNKPAELSGILDVNLKAYFRKGLVPVVLPPETDLDDVTDPNTYVGANLTDYEYSCTSSGLPFTTGSFSLEVSAMGNTGQIKQRITYCHKTASRVWERLYHSTDGVMSWGDWVCVSDFDGQLLWQGGWYMSDSQTANLNERVSKQRSGIVLVFSEYEGGVQDYGFTTFYIPKYMVAKYSNNTYNFVMSGGLFYHMACKTIVITDTQIIGHEFNIETGTGGAGIVYDNKKFVLRYVIGI